MAIFFRACLYLTLPFALLRTGYAQTTPPNASSSIRLTELDANEVAAPDYSGRARGLVTGGHSSENWLQVVLKFDTAAEWTDEITFTFYLALQGDPENLPEGSKPVNVFSGTVTLYNVPGERDHMVDTFLDANTFERYGKIFAIAALAEVNGEPPVLLTKQPGSLQGRLWWESENPNFIELLSRYDSPYRLIEVDEQGTIQP